MRVPAIMCRALGMPGTEVRWDVWNLGTLHPTAVCLHLAAAVLHRALSSPKSHALHGAAVSVL